MNNNRNGGVPSQAQMRSAKSEAELSDLKMRVRKILHLKNTHTILTGNFTHQVVIGRGLLI